MTDTLKDPKLVAAEVAKLEAETLKTHAETEAIRVEQELKRASLRKELAAAAKEEQYVITQRLHAEQAVRSAQLEQVSNFYYNEYLFADRVDSVSVTEALNRITAWHRLAPGEKNPDGTVKTPGAPMHIVIQSPGGSVIDGMHLFDQLSAYSLRGGGTHEVTITVRGYAASMAGILLQAADIRRIGKESYLMIHEISAGTGGKIGEIKDDVKWYELMCSRVADIFVARSGGKISLRDFKKNWERIDWWLPSDQALKLGFVDEIG